AAITFAGAVTLGVDQNLTANATGAVSVNSTSTITARGMGSIGLTTARNISLADGAVVVSNQGSITLSANQQSPATTGDFVGIDVNNATIEAIGTGAITLSGRGGTGGAGPQYGVYVHGTGGPIILSNSGAVTVTGTAG